MQKRTCRVCKIEKNINDYYVNNHISDGFDTRCKSCNKKYVQSHRLKNAERFEKLNERNRKKYRIKHGLDTDKSRLRNKRGEGTYTQKGYVILKARKNNPYVTTKNGDIFEHTLVMSEHLQRPLKKGETVHHKNGIRNDNRIENLELWSRNHPPGQRVEDKINWAIEFLKEYGYDVNKRI